MNFNPNPYDSHNATEMTSVTVPLDGFYQVSSPLYHWEPVPGSFETVPNPNRKWWQFWKPKHILQQKYRTWISHSGLEMRYFKKGDVIPVPKTGFSIIRIKN
jgi:hypothetical protein